MPYLTVRIKGQDGHTIQALSGQRVVCGRSSDCDIQLAAEAVSRQHVELYCHNGQWWVKDLGSANGVRVNRVKITEPTALAERSVIRAGSARLTFHLDDPSQAKPSSPRHDRVQAGADDPAEAIACGQCTAWVSIAHRSVGSSISCPRCNAVLNVPRLVAAGLQADDDVDEDED